MVPPSVSVVVVGRSIAVDVAEGGKLVELEAEAVAIGGMGVAILGARAGAGPRPSRCLRPRG